jgi:hypothetical protein
MRYKEADMFRHTVSLRLFLYAFTSLLALNLLSSSAFPIPNTVEPCITSSCPKQSVPSHDSTLVTSSLHPPALAHANATFSSEHGHNDNTTCSSGYAECKTDTGFVDCCDESKVRDVATNTSAVLFLRVLFSCSAAISMMLPAQDWKCFSFEGCRYGPSPLTKKPIICIKYVSEQVLRRWLVWRLLLQVNHAVGHRAIASTWPLAHVARGRRMCSSGPPAFFVSMSFLMEWRASVVCRPTVMMSCCHRPHVR